MFRWIRAFGKSLLIGANIIVALILLLSYVSTLIDPEKLPLVSLTSVIYGVFLLLNLFFIVFWLIVKKRLALISILAILLGVNHLFNYFQLIPDTRVENHANSLKIVSHNVKLFGWYNWKTNIEDRDAMIRNHELLEGDVYCFQEFFHHSRPGTFETRELLKRTLGTPHVYDEYPVNIKDEQHYGLATFSRFPILNKGLIAFENERSNACIYIDVNIGSDTIRIYNAHVASIRFSDEDHKFMQEFQKDIAQKNTEFKKGLGLFERLGKAYRRRAKQVRKITSHIERSPHPVVLCGDLNDTPISYSYNQISQLLNDSFKDGGWGIGNTYRGIFPSYRIDYIFYSPDLTAHSYAKAEEEISDHYPITAHIGW
ncbi:MAG: endonuclease/exonuclease/phosphatase family protein [Cryomorphaceae bacterium]